ncbi:Nucleoside triphosphate pyrophosphohydrolase [Sinobacterium norvegicum]|uniref:Nucleoside triphosphate pyrophosphohydrolase n=1 Tax=Sinobacterium norvegicum TaxID=1641715 RepID=A0ABN8EDK9_9GAMM|nr:nucleoside triphosphate pyrophosphohydrolase [Sinobacterium norvegicum]CAH0990407.1 Nucleoside triphosphate pyrophosphohydrolase [Sinobacterium norvegicum]
MTPYTMDDLLLLMARLRNPEDGCPWDLKQDFASIVPHTLEEVYELVDTIEQQDFEHLSEELGDLLFQVVFYAQLGKEQQLFDFGLVVSGIVGKLLRRHPHVFPDGTLQSHASDDNLSDQQIRANWERIKQQERKSKLQGGLLDDIPQALPAMSRAVKLQKRTATVGFDWAEPLDVIAKIEEETAEVIEAVSHKNTDAIEDEIGDLLFAVTNLSRKLDINPETALRRANDKFTRRFNAVEALASERQQQLDELELEQLDRLWDEVKKRLAGDA